MPCDGQFERLIRVAPQTGHVPRFILHRQDRERAAGVRRAMLLMEILDRNRAVRTNISRS